MPAIGSPANKRLWSKTNIGPYYSKIGTKCSKEQTHSFKEYTIIDRKAIKESIVTALDNGPSYLRRSSQWLMIIISNGFTESHIFAIMC